MIQTVIIFNSFSHPRVMIDALTGAWDRSDINNLVEEVIVDVWSDVFIDVSTAVMVGAGVGMLNDMDIILLPITVLNLEFAVSVSYVVRVLTEVVVDVLIGTLASVIVVVDAILAGVNIIILAAVMTALDFAVLVRLLVEE